MSDWPTPRAVSLSPEAARAIATAFGLGAVRDVALAARGWVSLNVTWRLETTRGVWAVKEVAREPLDALEAAAEIELAAASLGIHMPRMVRAETGALTVAIGTRVFRCHEFIEGQLPAEDLRESDAAAAGAALARIHLAALPFDPVLMAPVVFGEEHWRQLIEAGRRQQARWVDALQAALPGILWAEDEASLWNSRPRRWIGSHRDLRPHNTLRAGERLVVVDWDGAGPIVQGRELAGALKSWKPHDSAFLAGYAQIAGDVDLEEGSGQDGGLVWWLEKNVEHALALPGDAERDWAVSALAANFAPPA